MKNNSVFPNKKHLMRRVALFNLLQISLMCLPMGDSWILIPASAFHLLQYLASCSLWKTERKKGINMLVLS